MKSRNWWKLLYLLPICACTVYAGGYVAQFNKKLIRNGRRLETLPGTVLIQNQPPFIRLTVSIRSYTISRTICMGFFYV